MHWRCIVISLSRFIGKRDATLNWIAWLRTLSSDGELLLMLLVLSLLLIGLVGAITGAATELPLRRANKMTVADSADT